MSAKEELEAIKSGIENWVQHDESTKMRNPWELWNIMQAQFKQSILNLIEWELANSVTWDDVDTKIYPVGTYLFVESINYNPNNNLPGTWSKLTEGQAIVSGSTNSSSEYYSSKTLGSNTRTISRSNLPNENLSSSGTANRTTGLDGVVDLWIPIVDDQGIHGAIITSGVFKQQISSSPLCSVQVNGSGSVRDAFTMDVNHVHSVTVSGKLGSGVAFDTRQLSKAVIVWKRTA
jgi:hypothetical protein